MIGVPAPLASLFPGRLSRCPVGGVVRTQVEHPTEVLVSQGGHGINCLVAFMAVDLGCMLAFIHDVGATYWVMQVFLLPVALPIVVLFDRHCQSKDCCPADLD